MSEIKQFLTTDELEEGGYLKIDGNQVIYRASKIKRKITDPEERVRAEYYLELIKKYKYPDNRIQPNKDVPGRKPNVYADLVVFEDDEKKKPYIVVECKKDGISQAEITRAVEQVFGYANSLRAKYAVLVAGTVRIAFDVAGFKPSEREKNIIADIPERYGKVIKFRFKKGDSENDLKVATREELLAKFQQCHDTLWQGGKRNPAEAFDEMSKLMFCKIWDERFITKKGEYYKFQIGTHETLKEVTQRIRGIYSKAQKKDPGVFTEKIKAEDFIIYSVVELLQGISLARTELDIKGEAFEHFLGGVFRQAMGQYFTPRPIVKFMVDMLKPNEDDKIIDPACGSGGFLLYTLERVKKYLEDTLAPKDALDSWKDFALYQLFGIEINSQLARVAMMNMILHEDGHSNIENNDALDDPSQFDPRRDIKLGKYSLLLTNPPFGAVVKIREHNYLSNYELGAKVKSRNRQNTEILFIERCLDFLKPGGRMGIVLPDGILTNPSLQYARDFITDNAQILAVVSLPQTAFRRPHAKGGGGIGSGVKASLLFLRKKKEGEKLPENYSIFMAMAEHIGYDSTGRPDKNEFPEIVKAYQEYRKKKKIDFFVKTPLCFGLGRGELAGRLDANYYGEVRKFHKKYQDFVLLKDIAQINPKRKVSLKTFDEIVAYIGLPDTTNEGEIVNIDYRPYNMVNGRNIAYEGDILFARIEPSIYNRKYVFVRSLQNNIFALTSTEFYVVKTNEDINNKFLFWMLRSNFVYSQVFGKVIGTTGRRRLDKRAFENFKIPLPPRETQDKIANMMEEAYRIKREKEKEAEELLNSVDDYVLSQLGIELPELKDEQHYIFTFADIKGNRLDPAYYQPKYKNIVKSIENGKYEVKKLSEITESIISGQRPKGGVRNVRDGIPSLGGEHIGKDGCISDINLKYISLDFHKAHIRNSVKPNDILIVKDGATTGKLGIVPEGYPFKEANINEHLFRVRVFKNIEPYYLFSVLYSKAGKEQIRREISGGTIMGIVREAIKRLLIPVPSFSTQQKIASEVKSRREKAKALTKEAKEIIIKTKEEMERMIIGEKNQIRRQ